MRDSLCNLSEIHLNNLDVDNAVEQEKAFKAGAIFVAVLLHHKFKYPEHQYSREIDPIVGVSFTGLFDFFTNKFGLEWLKWFQDGRPETDGLIELHLPLFSSLSNTRSNFPLEMSANHTMQIEDSEVVLRGTVSKVFKRAEEYYLSNWRTVVQKEIERYCTNHNLRVPNRCTTVQPAGCLTKEAIRVSDSGLHLITDFGKLEPGEKDISSIGLTVREGMSVNKVIANEKSQLIKLTTTNNRELTLTPDHRLSVNGKWVQAKDLKVGSKLDFELGTYNNLAESELPVGFNFPSQMNSDIAYLLGAFIGSAGQLTDTKAIFYLNSEVQDYVSSRLQYIASNTLQVKAQTNKVELTVLTLNSASLASWLKLILGTDENSIPLAIRESSVSSLFSFICGLLDTCGECSHNGGLKLKLNDNLAALLQQVGEAIGICFDLIKPLKKSYSVLNISRIASLETAVNRINVFSLLAQRYPLSTSKHTEFNPYTIEHIEWSKSDYTYDYCVEGINDDDSWYWQGAIKSHNSKSLLTAASSGWHPPFGRYWIRRITFGKNDPIALAALDYGYNVIPGQEDKDENGQLLTDPHDERCTTWLVEVPCKSAIANIDGADSIQPSKFSAISQLDFYMQVQNYYTTHNTSGTPTLNADEVDTVAKFLFDNIQEDGGYISVALLSKSDIPFPRLPYEEIDEVTYLSLTQEVESRRKVTDFKEALDKHLASYQEATYGPSGCDSDKCLLPS